MSSVQGKEEVMGNLVEIGDVLETPSGCRYRVTDTMNFYGIVLYELVSLNGRNTITRRDDMIADWNIL